MIQPNTDFVANSLMTIPNNGELSLEQVRLLLAHEHDDQTVLELMRKFCLQTTSADISKKGMEFLYMNGFYNDLQLLINKNMKSANKSNRNWAVVYQLVIDRRLARYKPLEILKTIKRIKTDEPELKCVIEFVKITVYYELSEFGEIGNFLDKLQHLFEDVEDPLLVSYFNIRLYQNLFVYYWVRNELIMARKYAFRVLNHTTNIKTKVNLHINLGLTYTFDTYFQGMYHMSEALKLAKKNDLQKNVEVIQNRNIPFLSAHFKRTDGITTDDKSEQAHLEIAKGNHEKAVAILDDVPINSPFKLYYLGLAKKDKNKLLKSYNHFIEKRSDYFFGRLPLNAIKQMG
ncbi:AimR family lysis-lysogeny pheromone receptor [Virgibacillus ndiopensis]|uniref:AimR family lysis-lysogeny pheromone receptor n=1 Tax=Virgibacillus ndiopensis TaxID=2004408 RepID=UPI000C087D93|nr:AimR family lysis-lysogeny pheromone receptor [Virgibacillus ndiopensis]